ncbi:neuronal acetylcholine receptor subunit alpha-2 [Procambarus clarkii]|uniref:neuronal acetylcholine receptor subunit alpha-2 n=1 Tax=Procambarus clarkii TaxID=6728 RepID=UPI0037442491
MRKIPFEQTMVVVKIMMTLLLLWPSCEGYEDLMSQEQELRERLLRGYDRSSLPARTTQLRLRRLTLKHFDIHEDSHILEVDAWIIFEWIDRRLTYLPIGGIEKLAMDPGEIWMPDLRLYNSAEAGEGVFRDDTLTLVYPDGRVLYAPPARLRAVCVVDLTYWPHDTHNCSLVLGSWVHHGHTLDLRLLDKEPKVDIPQRDGEEGEGLTRGEWRVVEAGITRHLNAYDCCPEPYISLWVTFILTRDAPAYSWIIKLPVTGLSLLTLVVFLLPPGAGEKLTVGGLCLILDMLFVAYTSHVVAHAPSHTPLIVQLVCEQVIVVMVVLFVSVVVVRMVHHPHTAGLPRFLTTPLSYLAPWLFLSDYNNLVSGFRRTLPHLLKSEDVELGTTTTTTTSSLTTVSAYHYPLTSPHLPEAVIRHEWVFLAAVLDRICFLIYLLICFINFIRFHSVL